jgi:recombination protein RecR
MDPYPKPLRHLIKELKRLPGIGEKTATRLALYILGDKRGLKEGLAAALEGIKQIQLCPECFNLTDQVRCTICTNPSRDASIICVIEEPSDILALESANEFKGLYHVLHGLISPINGIGPYDIKLQELLQRMRPTVKEIVVALSPSVEGDITAQYIHKMICDAGLRMCISRLASGIPVGGELKYLDQVTIASAIRYRRTVMEPG